MILGNEIVEIRVQNLKTGEILAKICENEIETSSEDIVVIMTPFYDD